MNIGLLVDEVIKGTASALTLAAVLASVNFVRNSLLEQKLRRGFSRVGFSFAEQSFGIVLHNMVNTTVKVWGVHFSFPNGGYAPLHFSGEKVPFRKVRLRGFRQPRWQLIEFPPFKADHVDGAVSLDFDTSGTWELDKNQVIALHPPPSGAYCLVEYETLFHARRRIVVKAAQVDELQDAFLRYRRRWAQEDDSTTTLFK